MQHEQCAGPDAEFEMVSVISVTNRERASGPGARSTKPIQSIGLVSVKTHGSRKAVVIALPYQWSFHNLLPMTADKTVSDSGRGSISMGKDPKQLPIINSICQGINCALTRMSVLGQGPQTIIYYLHNLQLGDR
jgi:hypothetical protein